MKWILFAPILALVVTGCFDSKSNSNVSSPGKPAASNAPAKPTPPSTSPSPAPSTSPIDNRTIDICDRGAVGTWLAKSLGASSCHQVSPTKMANLKTLNLQDMVSWGDVDILPDSFLGLTSLVVLDLGYHAREGGVRNGRVTLHPGSFHGLQALQKLSLWAMWTRGLPPNVFEGLSSLKELNMWGFDPAARLAPGVFQGLDSLETLQLSLYYSHDQSITKYETVVHPDRAALVLNLFTGMPRLKKLDLSDCSLRFIQPGVFKGLDQLQILDISSNHFETVPAGAFADLPNLTDLSLKGNSPIRWLTYDENGNLNMVKSVIQPGAFQGLKALKHLDLELSAFEVFSKTTAGLGSDVEVKCDKDVDCAK